MSSTQNLPKHKGIRIDDYYKGIIILNICSLVITRTTYPWMTPFSSPVVARLS